MTSSAAQFPDFTLDSQLGPISYHSLIEGKWGLIITFHKAFDPVATTVRMKILLHMTLFHRILEWFVN